MYRSSRRYMRRLRKHFEMMIHVMLVPIPEAVLVLTEDLPVAQFIWYEVPSKSSEIHRLCNSGHVIISKFVMKFYTGRCAGSKHQLPMNYVFRTKCLFVAILTKQLGYVDYMTLVGSTKHC